jgi:L-threonylcarbamoyladenylate synthase
MTNLSDVADTLLRSGVIGVMPTDTVYGIVARAADPIAVARLYSLKKREHKPGTLIAADISQLVRLGIKHRYLQAVSQYWPGAISIVIPCGDELSYLHLGLHSLAVRIPNDAQIVSMLSKTGPLLTRSADQPGEPPATTMNEAEGYFGDTVDFYVDGGNRSTIQSSTVLRVVDDAVEVLRSGAVHIDETTGAILDSYTLNSRSKAA